MFVVLCTNKYEVMTNLGSYLAKKSINKANISRITGITQSRLSRLSRDKKAKLTAEELLLLSKALEIEPSELLKALFKNIKLYEV